MTFDYDLTLRESIAVLTYKQSVPFSNFRTLSEWLGCYQYILPDHRILIESALTLQVQNSASSIFNQYLFCIILENHYTESEQTNICRYIKCHSLSTPQLKIHKAR